MTHEEFIFKHQVLGEEIGCPYTLHNGNMYFEMEYHCYEEELPDNVVFLEGIFIYDNLKYLPKGMMVFGSIEIHRNRHITETPEDMYCTGNQNYRDSSIKYLNHIKSCSTIKGFLELPRAIESLPNNLSCYNLYAYSNNLQTLHSGIKVEHSIYIDYPPACSIEEYLNGASARFYVVKYPDGRIQNYTPTTITTMENI